VLCNIIRGVDPDDGFGSDGADGADGPGTATHSLVTTLGRHSQSGYFPSSSSYYTNHDLQSWAIHSVACVIVSVSDWIVAGREQEV
jgi:hypothetical protein